MSRGTGALQLSVAVGDYDRTRPPLDGRITSTASIRSSWR